jgi:hypothetical protein
LEHFGVFFSFFWCFLSFFGGFDIGAQGVWEWARGQQRTVSGWGLRFFWRLFERFWSIFELFGAFLENFGGFLSFFELFLGFFFGGFGRLVLRVFGNGHGVNNEPSVAGNCASFGGYLSVFGAF